MGTTVDSESEMNYSIDVPAQGEQTFNSLLMKLGARVAEGQYVTVKNVLPANTSDPTEPTDPVEPQLVGHQRRFPKWYNRLGGWCCSC